MTEKTKTNTLATQYNALTLELRASVIRYFKRQVKTTDIKAQIIEEAKRYFNTFSFGRDDIGSTEDIGKTKTISAITEAEAITLIPPGQSIEEETITNGYIVFNTCEVELAKIITPVPNLKKYTDNIIHVDNLAGALYSIINPLRDKLINDGIIHAYKTQKPKKTSKQSNKIRIGVEANSAIINKNIRQIDLFDQLYPTLPESQHTAVYAQQDEKDLSGAKQIGFGIFNKTDNDILTAVWELIADKSNTTNVEDINTFYKGEATQKTYAETTGGKEIELISPGVITTWAELTKRIYGSASKKDKDKIKEAVLKLWKDSKFHPILHYPIKQYKKGTKTISRWVTTWEPVITIQGITDINDETGERISADGTIKIFINPIFAANISNSYQLWPSNYLEQRRQIGQELGIKKAPIFLNVLYAEITNARSYAKQSKKDTYEVGLYKNSKGKPGLYYKLGLEEYEKNRNTNDFKKEFTKAIEYIKRYDLITDYEETKDATGLPMGVFTFKFT
jgi:hypothetical protein